MNKSILFGIIIAGGSGTRLWPKSRAISPKQFHDFVSNKSLIVETHNRVKRVIPAERTFIVTNDAHAYKIKEHLPQIPAEHMVREPVALGTAMAIALGAKRVAEIEPNARIAIFWADQHIKNKKEFEKALKLSAKLSDDYECAVLGVNPTWPSTALGYIKMGDEINTSGIDKKAFKLDSFKEKPDEKTAKKYLESWQYLWNTGMSVWKVKTYLKMFEKHLPEHNKVLEENWEKIKNGQKSGLIKKLKDLEPVPVDTAIFEKAKNMAVVPADLGWSDVGTWNAVYDTLDKSENNNVLKGGSIILHDTKNCLINSGQRLMALVGVKNLIVVDTDDAVLIAQKDRAPEVKEILNELKKKKLHRYL